MAPVLNEKYDSRIVFILTRLLRIYLPYVTVTVLGGGMLVYFGRLDLDMHTVFLNLSMVEIAAM